MAPISPKSAVGGGAGELGGSRIGSEKVRGTKGIVADEGLAKGILGGWTMWVSSVLTAHNIKSDTQ